MPPWELRVDLSCPELVHPGAWPGCRRQAGELQFPVVQGRGNPSLPPPQLFYLEEQRRLKLQQLATLIQKVYRGWRCRTHYQQMRKSQIVISAWFRGNKVPCPFPSIAGTCGLGCGLF